MIDKSTLAYILPKERRFCHYFLSSLQAEICPCDWLVLNRRDSSVLQELGLKLTDSLELQDLLLPTLFTDDVCRLRMLMSYLLSVDGGTQETLHNLV